MDLVILNREFEPVVIIDRFESIIWTDRYNIAGDFELYVPMPCEYFEFLETGNYISCSESDSLMIIEDIRIQTSTETGDHLIVSGRSLESILDRRVIWNQTTFENSSVLDVVYKLIKWNITEAEDERRIDNFLLVEEDIATLRNATISAQYDGENLYTALTDILGNYSVGMKVTVENGDFVFRLYEGTNRGYDQTDVPFVVFSPEFDNILESDYTKSTVDYKNVCLITGEGEGDERARAVVGTVTGLERREMKADNGDVSSKTEDGELPRDKYLKLLEEKATLELSTHLAMNEFNGKVDSRETFKYGTDFFMGDIVDVENAYGLAGPARVTEFIYSESEAGIETYPTFTAIGG